MCNGIRNKQALERLHIAKAVELLFWSFTRPYLIGHLLRKAMEKAEFCLKNCEPVIGNLNGFFSLDTLPIDVVLDHSFR